MFNLYEMHGGRCTTYPEINHPDEALALAIEAAKAGHTSFFRVFRQTPESATGERFEIAFSVIGGKVGVWMDSTFPRVHF